MILPMSGAPNVGQKPSPLYRAVTSELVHLYLDELMICIVYY